MSWPGDLLLRAENVSLGYGARVVLHDVQLELRRGEFWFFLGPNGSGKTTLARALLGLVAPRTGTLQRHPELSAECIGFVPQQCAFHPTLRTTVREFVTLGLVGLRLPRAEERRRIAWALEHVGMAGHIGCDFWTLSGGQQQRVLVSRALVRQPRLLIADEPTSGLDLAAVHALLTTLAELERASQTTIVFIAHDLAMATCYSSHVALFRDGRVWTGTSSEMLAPLQLQRLLGLPHELCVLGHHHHHESGPTLGELNAEDPAHTHHGKAIAN